MNCPVCRDPMLVVEHHRIELDFCSNCHGVWFDAGELELLLARLSVAERSGLIDEVLSRAEVSSPEKRRRCPVCRQPMRKTAVGDHPQILIDACGRGDGLWFDGGELGQFLKGTVEKEPSEHAAHQQIGDFLREVFQAPS